MKTVKASHEIFENAELDFEQFGIDEVEVSLGIHSAFRNQLTGSGDVACYCVGRDSDGKIPGQANTPGFVVRLHFDDLVEAGFTADEIWLSMGANRGEYLDVTGKACCADCLIEGGTSLEDWTSAPKNPESSQACVYCAEMFAEQMVAENQD